MSCLASESEMNDERPSFLECLCFCNPCCSNDGDDVIDDEAFLVDNDIQLSARSEDDQFTLPDDFDAIDEYYKSFLTLDTVNDLHLSINEEMYEMLCERLREGTRDGYTTLNSDLLLYKMSIRRYNGEEMIEHIKSYELFMDKYDSHRQQDEDNAQLYLDNARNHINKHEARVTYYKKAIYFTHDMTRKLIIRKEYTTYCQTLKRRSAL